MTAGKLIASLPPSLHQVQSKVRQKQNLFNTFTQNLGLESWQDKSYITKEKLDSAVMELKRQRDFSCLPLAGQRLLQRDNITARQAASLLRKVCAAMGMAVITKKVRHITKEGKISTRSLYRLAQ